MWCVSCLFFETSIFAETFGQVGDWRGKGGCGTGRSSWYSTENRGQWRQLWQAIGVEYGMVFFVFWREPFCASQTYGQSTRTFGIWNSEGIGKRSFDAVLLVGASTQKCLALRMVAASHSHAELQWMPVIAFSATIGSVQRVFQWLFLFIASWCLRCYGWRLKLVPLAPTLMRPIRIPNNHLQSFVFFGCLYASYRRAWLEANGD